MDITQIRYFLTTAETLNYTKAAEKLFLSRQALRQALSAMEKELGTELFVNRRNKLSLTAAGEYLKQTGKDTVEAFDAMLAGVQRFVKREAALRVALSVSLFPFMLPEADSMLNHFRSRYPALPLDVVSMENDQALEAVAKGEADCAGAVWMPFPASDFNKEVLSVYDTIISYGEKYGGWRGREMTAEDLAGVPCIAMGSLEKTLRPFYEECKRKGISLDFEVVPRTIDAFYRMTHNEAVGFDIGKADLPDIDDMYCSRLKDYTWEIGLVWRMDCAKSKEVGIFSRFMAEEYERLKAGQQQSGRSPLSRM